MKTNLTPIDKLDIVLKEIAKHHTGIILIDLLARVANDYHVIEENEKKPIIRGSEIERILLKLKDDKYISSIYKRPNHPSPLQPELEYYFTTFDGNLLLQNKGYKIKLQREEDAAFYEKVKSWAIVIGTILAGLYALWQFFQSLQEKCSCHHG